MTPRHRVPAGEAPVKVPPHALATIVIFRDADRR
jgi:hypothetical protein